MHFSCDFMVFGNITVIEIRSSERFCNVQFCTSLRPMMGARGARDLSISHDGSSGAGDHQKALKEFRARLERARNP